MSSLPRLDIHDYALQYARANDCVELSLLSRRNKELIFGYRDACLLQQTCGKVRLIRALGALLWFGERLQKDFDAADAQDVRRIVAQLTAHGYKPSTIATYKACLKRFMTWLADPEAFGSHSTPPPTVRWMTVHVRKRDITRLPRNALLTPAEIEHTLDTCTSSRNRAMISTLWETGARIGEHGNLRICDVVPAPYGYYLELNGKTGQRSILIVSSAPDLRSWLAGHPFREQPDAPLWLSRNGSMAAMQYASIRKLLQECFHAAGIKKRVYPHLFRHSRATHCLASGIFNEAQSKAYFGWTPGSDMLSTYSHLVESDANNALIRQHLTATSPTDEKLGIKACGSCRELNRAEANACAVCGTTLTAPAAHIAHADRSRA
jgi:site-specific recombinase XerD